MKTVYENDEEFERSRESRPLEESQIQHEDSEQNVYNIEDNLETYEENKNDQPVQEESNQINTFKTFMNNQNNQQEQTQEIENKEDMDFERLMNEVNENRYEGDIVIEAKPFRPLQYNANNTPVETQQQKVQVPVEMVESLPVVRTQVQEKPPAIINKPVTAIQQVKTVNTPQPKNENVHMTSSQYSQPTKTYVKITNTSSSNNININKTSPNIIHKRPVEIKRVEVRKNVSYSPQIKENKVSLAQGPVRYLKTNVRRRFIIGSNVIEESKSIENPQHQRVATIIGEGRRNENLKSSFDENSDYEEPVYYGNRPIKL